MDIKTNLSQDVLFMQTVVDGYRFIRFIPNIYKGRIQRICMQRGNSILERYLADSEISPADYWNTIIALLV